MGEASEQCAQPAAMGTLADRPLVHLLAYARNRRLSGRLELNDAGERSGTLELWRGRLVGAKTTPPIAYFGAVAYELGLIDTATHDATLLEIARTKRLHGVVLVERGALTPLQRDDILAEQICRKIHHLFAFAPEAIFSFYDARPAAEEPAFSVDPIRPAWRGLRDNAPRDGVRTVLDRYAGMSLRLANETAITSAGFTPDEAAICEALLLRPMTLKQIRATSTLPPHLVDLLAYLLIITKCAEPAPAPAGTMMPSPPSSQRIIPSAPLSQPRISEAPAASLSSRPSLSGMPRTVLTPGPPARQSKHPSSSRMAASAGSGEVPVSLSFRVPSSPGQPSVPPASAPRTTASLMPTFGPEDLGAAGIAHRAQSVDSEDFFEALALPDGAPSDAARNAYFRLAKLWHPDRLPPDLEPFRSEVQKIFTHMTRASATLTDPESYRDYLKTRDPNTAAKVIAGKPRDQVIRDIEVAIGKRDFAIAEETAKHLVSLDGDDAEALALAAWSATHAGEAAEEVLRTALPAFDKACRTDTYSERAHFFRGVVHKRLGSGAAAFRDFTRVTQIDPKHVDAQREIRILEMRARKGSGEHALDALIQKSKKK